MACRIWRLFGRRVLVQIVKVHKPSNMFLSCMGYSLHSGPTPRGRFESADRVSTARPGVAANMASRTISDLTIMLESRELLLVHDGTMSIPYFS